MFKRATGVILPPPVIYLLFLAAAWLLESVLPIALPRNLWTHYLGWGLIDAGVLLMLWAGLLMLWRRTTVTPDRKSVVSGESVSVRVALGGRRIYKKKKILTQQVE